MLNPGLPVFKKILGLFRFWSLSIRIDGVSALVGNLLPRTRNRSLVRKTDSNVGQ